MGLLMLDYIDAIIEKQKKLTAAYREALTELQGIKIYPEMEDNVKYNYSYF